MKEEASEGNTTLGDVLYSDGAVASESEKEWVALLQSAAARDAQALYALYERAHRLVYTLILRITGSPETAEELTLQVFYEVWSGSLSYEPGKHGSVLACIMNQARSRAIEWRHGENRAAASPDGAVFAEQSRLLREALQALTPQEREAIESVYFSDVTPAQKAARLNQPSGALRTWIRSGLMKLRQALERNP